MSKRFVTPGSEIQTAKILAESARNLDPELAYLYDEGSMLAAGAAVIMPEAVTNPRVSLLWRAKFVIGNLLTSRTVEQASEQEQAYLDGLTPF